MDFDFLPNLPKSDLDDRGFNDLMQECLLRIPRYCPEWTHHNPSDPGITIVELFAWLTDQMLMRFNQVPRRNYVAFLELLGIRLQPPTPARTELTFYLSRERAAAYTIEAGAEVATERTEGEESIIFSTDRDLVIGTPRIQHLFAVSQVDRLPERPINAVFLGSDRLAMNWQKDEETGRWTNDRAATELFPGAQVNSCFYLVLEHHAQPNDNDRIEHPLRGNVLSISFRGEPAGGTGSNPNHPPRRWQAWDERNQCWQDILAQEADDNTDGFNFDSTPEADVKLHLPVTWEPVNFNTDYTGYWIRCIHELPPEAPYRYMRSPRITGLSVRAIGGTVTASQCAWIREPELLGISDGTPGQRFPLQARPVLQRSQEEYVVVCPPGTPLQADLHEDWDAYRWQEVKDFAESSPEARHYTIDDRTGIVQFGPTILEPGELQGQTLQRAIRQPHDSYANGRVRDIDRYFPSTTPEPLARRGERQYGAIPPKGHEIYITRYRWGGGKRGNVKAGTLTKLMQASPYVRNVVNAKPALGGTQSESLEDAVMRVPAWLRSRERAVTREDFEYILNQFQDVARVRCLDAMETKIPGKVELLGVPAVAYPDDFSKGMEPRQFTLNKQVRDRLQAELDDRKLLGVNVEVREPDYVGVKVRVQIVLTPEYAESQKLQEEAEKALKTALYTFLNPVAGGVQQTGWDFGASVHRYEIADCCQKVAGVSSVLDIELLRFEKRPGTQDEREEWHWQSTETDTIKIPQTSVVCSWANRPASQSRVASDATRFTDHDIYFLNGFEQYQPPPR